MPKNNKWTYAILILSLINWLPALNVVFIHIPMLKIWAVMILAYFITPAASVLYIIAALVLMIRRKSNFIVGSGVIVANLTYLLWGMQYLKVILYAA